jgi:tRNA pseudouridine32 synthase / 23S rRNA pseudouridine746 synthase
MSLASALRDLPTRDGVGASRVVIAPGRWSCVIDFLLARFPHISAADWQQRLAQGLVLGDAGQPLQANTPATDGGWLYYYRAVESETSIPFEHQVLYRDAHLLVVDKPHFLPVIPSGKYLQHTLLTRLKKTLDVPDIVPIHRIDRDTAGLVLFSLQAASRDAYSALFRERRVEKTYEALAAFNPALAFPVRRESRIQVGAHFMQQAEVPGPVNAITDIDVLEVCGPWARYRLRPLSGQRHQLRVHMMALGLPILNDGIYPQLTPEGSSDQSKPLQLLAKSLAFEDPISGQHLTFESQLRLLPLPVV